MCVFLIIAAANASLEIPSTQTPLRRVQLARYGIDGTTLGILLAIFVGLAIIVAIAAAIRNCFRRDQPRDFCFALPNRLYKPFYHDWGETTFTSERY